MTGPGARSPERQRRRTMKIRITIEYDPDWPEDTTMQEQLGLMKEEQEAWRNGHVDITDVEGVGEGSTVKWEIIP